jgi:hypothetical protein
MMATYNPYVMGADNVNLYYETGTVSTEETTLGSMKALFR